MQHPRSGEAWSVMLLFFKICFKLCFFADKLTNHCLHCHVFTKAPLPCEVDDLCNSSTLHIRHAHMFHSSYTYICLFTPFALQTCCAVVFCSKDCRRKATQGYHRFREPLIMISRSTCHRYECEMRLYELLPMEGKEMFGYFLALR